VEPYLVTHSLAGRSSKSFGFIYDTCAPSLWFAFCLHLFTFRPLKSFPTSSSIFGLRLLTILLPSDFFKKFLWPFLLKSGVYVHTINNFTAEIVRIINFETYRNRGLDVNSRLYAVQLTVSTREMLSVYTCYCIAVIIHCVAFPLSMCWANTGMYHMTSEVQTAPESLVGF
jgi:hypothetical protein